MATINELAPAVSVSDTDAIPIWQNGITRQATRAQLLAGVQPQIALPSQTLFGRAGSGTGAPEAIAIGANLTLQNGTLAANSAREIASLPEITTASGADLVPVSAQGADSALSYADFMAGIASVSNVSASGMVAAASGTARVRRLGDIFADSISIEAFGAAGDGITDDTEAFNAALSAGKPILLGPTTYIVNGQWSVYGSSVAMMGVPGQTVLRRLEQTGNGAWISVQSGIFCALNIIFDANRTGVSTDSWAILVTPSCTNSEFQNCVFTGSAGATQGCGLTIQASDPEVVQHTLYNCEAYNNAGHGIWVQAVRGVHILGCRAHDNGGYGIDADYADPAFVQKVHLCQITGCEAWGNQRGISVGNFNATNINPPTWGNGNPDALAILVVGNNCHDNYSYGISASGRGLSIQNNLVTNNGAAGQGAGILANVSYSVVTGNMITGNSFFGIDAGGSIYSDISENYVNGVVNGINPGGSLNMRIRANWIEECTGWAIVVNNVETDGAGNNFGIACNTMAITENWICYAMASGGGGVLLLDGPQNVFIARNSFVGIGQATIYQALWANTDTLSVLENTWNFQPRDVCNPASVGGVQQIAFPDILDQVMVTAVTGPVQSMVTLRQQATAGQITFINVTNGGSGYSAANVAISGSGAGAAAEAYVSDGAVIGVTVTNAGSGYGADGVDTAVVITGDGTGAIAVASVGLPVPEERRLRIRCNCSVVFARLGSTPFQENWTLYDITVPATADIDWVGTWGTWHAASVPLADYLKFAGDGSLTICTLNNANILVRPGGTGNFCLTSDAEPTGVTSSIGRGSPLGTITATPGSDYRNLNGGAGQTFWIKQTGTDASGWIAVA